MRQHNDIKSMRTLSMYTRFLRGEILNKAKLAREYGVAERSVQRDIDLIRAYLERDHPGARVVYDRGLRGYKLVGLESHGIGSGDFRLIWNQVMSVRLLKNSEAEALSEKLISCVMPPEERKELRAQAAKDLESYTEREGAPGLRDTIFKISGAIRRGALLEVGHQSAKTGRRTTRLMEPVELILRDGHFCVEGRIIEEDEGPEEEQRLKLCRVDKIETCRVIERPKSRKKKTKS